MREILGDDGDNLIAAPDSEPYTLVGRKGADTLVGGVGADVLYGDDDDDRLTGGQGDDEIDGGAGIDIVDYAAYTDQSVDVDLGDETAIGVRRARRPRAWIATD